MDVYISSQYRKTSHRITAKCACSLFDRQKIILRLLAASLSTTANQLSATSVLIQQNQHGDYKQNDMASFAETLYKAPTKSERNLFL